MIHFLFAKAKIEISEDYISEVINEEVKKINSVITNTIERIEDGYHEFKISLSDSSEINLIIKNRSYSSVRQLEVMITESIGDLESNRELEDLKISLKDRFLKEWEVCHWIKDFQSSKLSEKLYLKIHQLENRFREIVNLIMLRKHGVNWWNKYSPMSVQKKYNSRKRDFLTIAPSFKGVNDKLLSIDVDDLVKLMKYKQKELNTDEAERLVKSYESIGVFGSLEEQIKSQKSFISEFEKHLVSKEDLWEEIFSNYFDNDFFDKWVRFKLGRNHIAHNKLIDIRAFNKISKEIIKINDYLDEINKELEEELTDEELTRAISDYEEEEEHFKDLEFIEQDTGIKILDNEDITEQFNLIIQPYFEALLINYYFNEDVETTVEELDFELENQDLFRLIRERDEKNITVSSTLVVNNEPGQRSTLLLELSFNGNEIKNSLLYYTNGEVYFDADKGYYLPLLNNEIDASNIEEFMYLLEELIAEKLHDYKEDLINAEGGNYDDGGRNVIAEFPCENCSESYVSIDASIYPYGKCANCEYEHSEIKECVRCEYIYNGSWEGGMDFCDSCFDHFESE